MRLPTERHLNTLLLTASILLGRSLSANAQPAPCAAMANDTRIVEVGAYSSMRYTEEHAYGFIVMLWRAGPCLFGFFESSDGLAGDTPMGALQDVRYNTRTGVLSFSAKLSVGLVSAAVSRDLFTFNGTLQPTRLTGIVTHAIQNDSNAAPVRQRVVMLLSKPAAELTHGPATYAEWQRQWDPVLQRRGPHW